MVRGMFVKRSPSERMTLEAAMKRYLAEITPTKRPFTQQGEKQRAVPLVAHFGKYALACITPELVAAFRDKRLAGEDRLKDGEPRPRAANTVRLELALLGHLFTVAIKEWGSLGTCASVERMALVLSLAFRYADETALPTGPADLLVNLPRVAQFLTRAALKFNQTLSSPSPKSAAITMANSCNDPRC